MIRFAAAIAALSLVVSPALASPCRDAKGKFISCPPAAKAAPKRCKDARGKFAKCGTLGSHPA